MRTVADHNERQGRTGRGEFSICHFPFVIFHLVITAPHLTATQTELGNLQTENCKALATLPVPLLSPYFEEFDSRSS